MKTLIKSMMSPPPFYDHAVLGTFPQLVENLVLFSNHQFSSLPIQLGDIHLKERQDIRINSYQRQDKNS